VAAERLAGGSFVAAGKQAAAYMIWRRKEPRPEAAGRKQMFRISSKIDKKRFISRTGARNIWMTVLFWLS
jgi:hypothetical protein